MGSEVERDQTSSQVRWVQPAETFLLHLPAHRQSRPSVTQAAPPPPQMRTAAWSLLSEMEGAQGGLPCTGIGCPNARSNSDPDSVLTSCSAFCWSWLKSLHSQAEGCWQHRAAAPCDRCPLFSSHLLTTCQHALHSLFAPGTLFSSSYCRHPFHVRKGKKLPQEGAKWQEPPAAKLSPGQERARQPEEGGPARRGRRRWLRRARPGCRWHCGLRQASAGSTAGLAGPGDRGRAHGAGQGWWVFMQEGALPAALPFPRRCVLRQHRNSAATRARHCLRDTHPAKPPSPLLRMGRARLTPGFAGSLPAPTAVPSLFRPPELGLSLSLNQPRCVRLPAAPAALSPRASKSLQGAKRCQKLLPVTPFAKLWLWPPTQHFALQLRSLSDEDTRLLPCSPQGH